MKNQKLVGRLAVIAIVGLMLGSAVIVRAQEVWAYKQTDPEGDVKLGHSMTGFYDEPIANNALDLTALEARDDAQNLYWQLTLKDVPSATDVSDQKTSWMVRYLVYFGVKTSMYSACIDVQYVLGESSLRSGKGSWASDNWENAPNPISEYKIDPASNTIVFTIKKSDIGNPATGDRAVGIKAATYFGALSDAVTPPGSPYALITPADNIPGDDVSQYSQTSPACPDYVIGGAAIITVPGKGALIGKVTSEEGDAVAGAKITATLNGSITSTTTDNNGTYQLTNLDPGSYNVTCECNGYETKTQQINVAANATLPLDFILVKGEGGAATPPPEKKGFIPGFEGVMVIAGCAVMLLMRRKKKAQ